MFGHLWFVPAVPGGLEICPGTYQCSLKIEIWDAPDVMIGLRVDDGPDGDSDANLRLYDPPKS